MMGLIIAIHLIICILLIAIILVQAGRGGGLVEGFSGVESMFGTKTSAFLTRTTTILAVLFFITCISLALLSAHQSRSLMKNIKTQSVQEATKQEIPKTEGSSIPEAPMPQEQKTQNSKPEVPNQESAKPELPKGE